jgi:hypothetical protein
MGAVLERPQAPARHRLDVGAYYRMAEAGILSHSERVELIDGDIFDMNPIGSRHARRHEKARAAIRPRRRRGRRPRQRPESLASRRL